MTPGQSDLYRPRFARFYERVSVRAETRGVAAHRRELLEGLQGRVIEVGCGNGLNFGYYPASVTGVVAVEPEPQLRKSAEKAAAQADLPVTVIPGLADELPAEEGAFDAAVASLVLCSVPVQATALAEIFRVLRGGGELRFYEHVRATTAVLGPLLRFAQATFWPKIAGGCHPARDTERAITEAGFVIERMREFRFSASRLEPAVPHILGVARKP